MFSLGFLNCGVWMISDSVLLGTRSPVGSISCYEGDHYKLHTNNVEETRHLTDKRLLPWIHGSS